MPFQEHREVLLEVELDAPILILDIHAKESPGDSQVLHLVSILEKVLDLLDILLPLPHNQLTTDHPYRRPNRSDIHS